jgi:hypothetical protein
MIPDTPTSTLLYQSIKLKVLGIRSPDCGLAARQTHQGRGNGQYLLLTSILLFEIEAMTRSLA